jgi:hypothetical protein
MDGPPSERKVTVTTAPVRDFSAPRVAGIAVLVSLFSFLYYYQRSDLLLYGDAVAHINIARRVFDSLTPGPLQLGTVWLPLPHLLMIPFLWSDSLWQSGAGGSFPSMIAFVFGVAGIFRLVRGILQSDSRAKPVAGVGAWAAAFAYAANPNLIYMQATAMTESLYLALFIWAVVYFAEFLRALKDKENDKRKYEDASRALAEKAKRKNEDADRRESGPGGANQLSPALQRGVARVNLPKSRRDDPVFARTLMRCALCLAAAELTRYDGWFLAGAMGAAVAVITLTRWRSHPLQDRALRRNAAKFLVAIALAPVLWLAYNHAVYGNALEFANGPYSARAIEQRVHAPNPALHNAAVAAIYFLKSAQLNLAVGNWGRYWLAAALIALAIAAWKLRPQSAAIFLLWLPLLFYAFSIAYGSVPIHVSTWWPFATFNQRYGLQLLPMFAVSIGLLTASLVLLGAAARHSWKLVVLLLALVMLSYAIVWKAEPQCLQEARRNWRIQNPLNSAVERVLVRLPQHSRFLMELGEHVGVMEHLAIPLRQVVNNENHRPWKHPSDPEGLWERALADPPRYVDFVIAFDGDAVDQRANKTNLAALAEVHAAGQPHARIYAARPAPNRLR